MLQKIVKAFRGLINLLEFYSDRSKAFLQVDMQQRQIEMQHRQIEMQHRQVEMRNWLETMYFLQQKYEEYELPLFKKTLLLHDFKIKEVKIQTNHPVASQSPDHLIPRGTKNDNSIYPRFNKKLCQLIGDGNPLSILDLGCAGGGFVESLIFDGHFAVGVEGSDYSKKIGRAAWGVIPGNLFTADLTKSFQLSLHDNTPLFFDVITAWEVMEHIAHSDISQFAKNILSHLKDEGIFVCSIAIFEDSDPVTGTVYHQTVESQDWWIERFLAEGFSVVEQEIIGKDDWLRGGGNGPMDWHEDQGMGFHLVLKKAK